MIEQLNPADEFVESLGLVAEADGLPRIAGRILGLLIVEEGPFQFDDLVERLKVSRGSVSTNTRHLESIGLIERFTVPGERRDFFRLVDDHYGRLLESHTQRLRRIQGIVERCRGSMTDPSPQVAGRLTAMSRFYELAIRSADSVLDEWRRSDEDQASVEAVASASNETPGSTETTNSAVSAAATSHEPPTAATDPRESFVPEA